MIGGKILKKNFRTLDGTFMSTNQGVASPFYLGQASLTLRFVTSKLGKSEA